MQIKIKDKIIADNSEMKSFLNKYNVHVEFWEPDPKKGSKPLEIYGEQVEELKKKFGYASADCCTLDTTNPELENMLKPFLQEHHHTDDEVRFTVDGEGIFGINPLTDPEFEIHVEKGDLILVPAYTRHWFKPTNMKSICCLRIFKENPKWEAVYEMPKEGVK